MYRTYLLILSLLVAVAGRGAETGLTAEKCFTEAPSSLIPLLPTATRLDMLDYFKASSPKASLNAAEGQARILSLSDQSLTFQISEGITAQIFVLNPRQACPVIGYIETVSLPVQDSVVRFFNCRWQPVDVYRAPELADWLKGGSKSDLQALQEAIPFLLVSAEYDPGQGALVLTNTTDGYFAPTDRPAALQSILPKIAMRWTGKKFKK